VQKIKNLYLCIVHNLFLPSRQKLNQEVSPDSISMAFPELMLLTRTYDQAVPVPEILCLGDSVWERLSREDLDQRSIGQMLQENLPPTKKTISISHSAYNLRIFLGFIRAIEKMRSRPQCVILPINLRSFSPQWFLNPLLQFACENQLLEEYCINPKISIPIIKPIREHPGLFNSFDSTSVDYPNSEYKTLGEFRELVASKPADEAQSFFRLSQIFLFHYMHPLVQNHPLLQALDDILQKLTLMEIKTIIYITPINYQAGLRFTGKDFLSRVALNIKMIYESVARSKADGKIDYRDYSTLLSSECFFSLDNATEHLNERGRKILVEQLTKDLVLSMDLRKGEQ
jgi:hypothetical protein